MLSSYQLSSQTGSVRHSSSVSNIHLARRGSVTSGFRRIPLLAGVPRVRNGECIRGLGLKEARDLLFPFVEEVPGATENNPLDSEQFRGNVYLLLVAFLWGTYDPTTRFLFSMSGAPLPSTLCFVKAVLSTLLLLTAFQLTKGTRPVAKQSGKETRITDTGLGALGKALTWKSGSLLWSVLELGLWETCGAFLHTIGISLTSATSAAFLIHTTTVFTPALASFTGESTAVR